jgi:nucleoside-diphosphate-sugar epimerase
MTSEGGIVAVTGASGFIGGNAVRHLTTQGVECLVLGRRSVGSEAFRRFELGPEPDPGLFDGVRSLVHCAYDFSARASQDIYQRNVVGTSNLLRAAVRAGVDRVVFISSMSAYPGTHQLYGRAKLESERLVHEIGGLTLRLGLVWGPDAGGMAGAVQRLTALPVVPVFGLKSHQFTVHRDAVDAAIAIAIARPELVGVISVANPEPVPVRRLLRGLARMGGQDDPRRLVPVPWRPVYWSMRAAEAARLPLPLRADSVLGLVQPAPSAVGAEVWPEHGVTLRPFPL